MDALPLLSAERMRLARALSLFYATREASRAVLSVSHVPPGLLDLEGEPRALWVRALEQLQARRPDLLRNLVQSAASDHPYHAEFGWALERLDLQDGDARVASVMPESPYRFLQPFGARDRALFFGRVEDVHRMLVPLTHPKAPSLCLLSAPSGAGKTSFVQAGLLPRLERYGFMPLVRRATAEPLEVLAGMLTWLRVSGVGHGGPCTAAALETPSGLEDALLDVERSLGAPPLLVLDQAEEVFTLAFDVADRAAGDRFFRVLHRWLTGPRASRARLLLVVREDFRAELEARLAPLPRGEAWRALTLDPLDRAGLLAALLGPSGQLEGQHEDEAARLQAHYGFRWDPATAEALVTGLQSDARGPVALRLQVLGGLLWERLPRATGAPVTWGQDALAAVGGVADVLPRYIQRVLNDPGTFPDDRALDLAQLVLWSLVRESGGVYTAGTMTEASLRARFASWGLELDRCLKGLADRWIIERVTDREDQPSVRLIHDGVAPVIAGWADVDVLTARRDLEEGIVAWRAAGGPTHGTTLVTGLELELVRRHRAGVVQTEEERRYVELSEAEAREIERRRRRRRRILLAALMLAALLGGALLVALLMVTWVL